MFEYKGVSVSAGIAVGKLYFYHNLPKEIPEYMVEDPQKEWQRYQDCLQIAKKQLQQVYDNACKRISKKESVIFQTHIMILEDSKFVELVQAHISEGKNAEYAVYHASQKLANLFLALDDEYFKARYTDMLDAGHILLDVLINRSGKKLPGQREPVIIAASDLMPSDTMSFTKGSVLGFVTNEGSANSHSSIIARTMGLPSVVQVQEVLADFDGHMAILDGLLGRLILDPDETTIAQYQARKERYEKQQERLRRQIGLPSETKEGRYVRLSADIGRIDEIDKVRSNDAQGIGMFHCDALFMNRDKEPSEEEQFEVYRTIVRSFPGEEVRICLANGSSEKKMNYLDIPREKNPALGFRGVRIALENPAFFRRQLRALCRASGFGKLSIALPMVSSIEEVEYAKRELSSALEELRRQGEKTAEHVPLGVVIETPSAALISQEICQEVDFIVINTSNLIQFTLCMDKDNPKLMDFYRPYHLAVKRLLKMVILNAHKAGKKVAVGGQLAWDASMTPFLLALRTDELILIPSHLLRVKAAVREMSAQDLKNLLDPI